MNSSSQGVYRANELEGHKMYSYCLLQSFVVIQYCIMTKMVSILCKITHRFLLKGMAMLVC